MARVRRRSGDKNGPFLGRMTPFPVVRLLANVQYRANWRATNLRSRTSMNPIGAALLACAAAGCAWSAWVSLRGRWRVIVITVSAALAVIVPAVQLGGSTPTTERVSPPLPESAGGHE